MVQQGVLLALYSTYRRDLVNYANSFTGDMARAEDIVQEAWLRLQDAAQKQGFRSPRSYLYSIVRNLALDGRRREKRERMVVVSQPLDTVAEISADRQPSVDQVLLHRDEMERLYAALAELPERTRIAFEMHRFGERKLREIAAFLDVSVAKAHTLVVDALEHCKERLDQP
nr:sigma-70 family RNA polymerase sigma factor [Acetobacter senegalensis]